MTIVSRVCAAGTAALMLSTAVPAAGQGREGRGTQQRVVATQTGQRGAIPGGRLGFSIVLLLGDIDGSGVESVPPGVQRALADVKDFLPYRSYRLLDTQYTLCCAGGTPAVTRMRGVDEQEYEASVRISPVPQADALSVRFALRDVAETASVPARDAEALARRQKQELEIFEMQQRIENLNAQIQAMRRDVEVGLKDKRDLQSLEAMLRDTAARYAFVNNQMSQAAATSNRAVMEAAFQMAIGESIVVGTSRLKGDRRALIAIVTAVKSSGQPQKTVR